MDDRKTTLIDAFESLLKERKVAYSHNHARDHFTVMADDLKWDVWPTTNRWRREPHQRSVSCLDTFWADLESRSRKSPDAQNAERWTPGLLRLETLEARVDALDQSQARRLAAIESFLWAEAGYNPAYRIEVAGIESKTVTPAPEATGRAGEGRAAIKSREAAHAAAVRLHDYCDRNGYEGIGHSIGLLVEELKR